MSGQAVDASLPSGKALKQSDKLIIRGYPSVVFFWPTAFISLLFFFLGAEWWGIRTNEAGESLPLIQLDTLAMWWLIAFALNMLVFSLDFGRIAFITVFTSVGMVLAGLTALHLAVGGVWTWIHGFFAGLDISMNSTFYLAMFVVFSIYLGIAVVKARFDYLELGANELVRKYGLLGDAKAYSTLHMHVEKEIPDIFEWVLFGSGKLIFKPGGIGQSEGEALVIRNVFRVNSAEKRVKQFMGTIKVKQKV